MSLMSSHTSTSAVWQPALHRLGRFFSNARAGLPFVNTSTTASNNGSAAGISSLPTEAFPPLSLSLSLSRNEAPLLAQALYPYPLRCLRLPKAVRRIPHPERYYRRKAIL